jgi:class 3 adenylate cyclase
MDHHQLLPYTPQHLLESVLTSRDALAGERKQVTVLFCDLTNSTALAERLGPDAMHTLLNHFFTLALEAVHRYEGTLNQFLGDGFMALFGAPVGHEDHARRAVLAALALQQSLRASAPPVQLPPELTLAVRMGMNTGLVVVGCIGNYLRLDYTAVGDTTNLAARLQHLAQPGRILLSAATLALLGEEVYAEPCGPLHIKGKRQAVQVYQLLGYRPRHSVSARLGERVHGRFVGRQPELAHLHTRLAQAARGRGQVVCLEGDIGMGKSRLLYAFRHSLATQPVTYLEGRCLACGDATPYMPVRDILRHSFGISDDDSPEIITAKAFTGLRQLDVDPEENLPDLLALLDGAASVRHRLATYSPGSQERTGALLRQMCQHGSQRQPLVIEIEDLHWIDRTSEAYLEALAASLADMPVLLITSYRPGYSPPWRQLSYSTHMRLQPLTSDQSRAVVETTLGGRTLPESALQALMDTAEGNPFFLEELARAAYSPGESHTASAVPGAISSVLMAQVDRLPEALKQLLQVASVLGRTISLRLLEAIWQEPTPLAPLAQQLQQRAFLYAQHDVTEPGYCFAHALLQKVVYESLLASRRQLLHTALAQAQQQARPTLTS